MNDNTIVIYKSATGFTKNYATMIAKELNCNITDYSRVTPDLLSKYTLVIFGGRCFVGGVDGLKKIKNLINRDKISNFIVFSCGATPNYSTELINESWKANLTPKELTKIPHFYMQGGIDYSKMSFVDKKLMQVFTKVLKRKKNKSEYETGMLETISSSYDISSDEYIEPLVSYVRNIIK